MRQTQKSNLIATIAVFAAWAASADAASIQFDFGDNGVYAGTVAPAHAAGLLSGLDTTWNGIAGTSSNGANTISGLKYTDGSNATGVTLNFWRSSNFSFPIKTNDVTGSAGVGIYDTTLIKDSITQNGNVGVRVQGLAVGTYNVYAIVLDPDNTSQTFTVGMGVGVVNATISIGDPVVTDTTVVNPAAKSGTWIDGENYALAAFTTTSTNDWINVLIDPTGDPGRIVGLQIVLVPEPEPVALVLLGIGGMMMICRRRSWA